jgi:hypothetical protein
VSSDVVLGILIWFIARRLYNSFGVKRLIVALPCQWFVHYTYSKRMHGTKVRKINLFLN